MAQERLSMRKIKEVLRLKHDCGLTNRQIARSCHVARSTVGDYLRRADEAGIGWPVPADVTEGELEARLFPEIPSCCSSRPLPDFATIHQELKAHRNVHLTLDMLWREYKEQYPDGYQYSQFCHLYHRWLGKLSPCMRQDHRGGEKLFVDYTDGLTLIGQSTKTQLFVAVWGASNYTYAEATLTQQLPDWIGSHVRALEYFGCVAHAVVPDCLKSGVHQACFYEPDINPTYADLASHYGFAVLPARPRHPRDKAKVEVGVLIVQRWILAALRHHSFHSIPDLNQAILSLLQHLNTRPLRKIQQSRLQLFQTLDHPNALCLPETPYEYAEWKKATVNIDYHIEVAKHYYSVPFRLVHEKVDVRLTANTVEVLLKGERVAAHVRSTVMYGHTTLKEHMPPSHQKYLEWTPSRIVEWASKIGSSTAQLVEKILASRAHPEQGYRSCLGILRLEKHYPKQRIEAAALRALKYNVCSFRSLRSILTSGLDRLAQPPTPQGALPLHENIRGETYYQ